MKRFLTLFLVGVMGMALLLSSCGNSNSTTPQESGSSSGGGDTQQASGTVYEIKYANLGAAGGPHDMAAAALEEELNRVSMERLGYEAFDIVSYPSGQLAGSDNEQFDMVMQGTIQYSTCPNSVIYQSLTNCPELNALDLPYLFPDHDSFYAFAESDIMQEMFDKLLEATGVRAGAGFIVGDTYISSNTKEIHLPQDLAGQKIRSIVSDVWVGTLQAYGGNPTPIAYSEVYTALQQGTVDGVMAASASYTDMKFYEVVDYISKATGLLTINFEIWNQAWIDSLPEDVRSVLVDTLDNFAMQNRRDVFETYNANADQEIIDSGAALIELTEEEEEQWKEIAYDLYPQFADLCGGMENIEKIQSFVEEFEAQNS